MLQNLAVLFDLLGVPALVPVAWAEGLRSAPGVSDTPACEAIDQRGQTMAAQALRTHARQQVSALAQRITDPDLRASWLGTAPVAQLSRSRQDHELAPAFLPIPA